jgi:drug efflux transport system permease protein
VSIVYLSQRFSLYGDLSVDENIAFFAEIHGLHMNDQAIKARRTRLLELTQLAPFRDRLADQLSGGMKQKLALACRKLLTGQRVPVQVVINGDNSNAAATVMGYALRILQASSTQYQVQPITSSGQAISAEPRVWYNPELRSALFLVPGLIAYIGMISAVISTALSVVREKERGTMEQVRMASLSTVAYIVGKTLPYFCISMGTSLAVILASMLLFGLPMNGSWLMLILSLSIYLAGALGLGLMISTVADSQQAAFQMAILASFLPTMILSGFVFPIASMPPPIRAVDPYLEGGRAWMALAIPPRYGENLATGRPTSLQIVADGSDASSTNIALGYASTLIAGYAQDLVEQKQRSNAAGGQPSAPGIDPRVRVWFNPTVESRYFMLPGIFALLLLVVTSNLSSMAIVREREVGTLEQLNVTPLGRLQLILGKLLPYGAIGMIDAMIVLLVIVFWFQVPLRGSFWLLLAISCVYLLTTLGLGLFISTISNTQQQAMMTSTFFFMTPMMYLSGFIFPIENMPAAIQPLTYLIPLRYFVIILRGDLPEGSRLETLWPQALGLLIWGVVILTLAVLRSSKRLA